jgi:dephospho-CoA kinase
MSYKTGITGGIGSGKTSVCMIFETLGIPVYYSDTRAKQLTDTDPELKTAIANCFGSEIYCCGTLNRRKLAEIVFNDKVALEKLNSLVHPAVARDFEQWQSQQTSPYTVEESAIIFESGIAERFDKIILVTAPEEIRIERVCARDNVAPEAVRERIKNQLPDEKKIAFADYIIYNDNMRMVIPQVIEIHKRCSNHGCT